MAAKRGGVFHHKILLKTQIMITENKSLENVNEPSCLGAVSSSLFIGDYKIEVVDQDYFKITKKYDDKFFNEATVCGGDLETLLSCLFIRQEIKYTCYDRVMKTDIVPFEDNVE